MPNGKDSLKPRDFIGMAIGVVFLILIAFFLMFVLLGGMELKFVD